MLQIASFFDELIIIRKRVITRDATNPVCEAVGKHPGTRQT